MARHTTGISSGTIAAFALGILLVSGGKIRAEYVFLKNGTVIEGKILHETPSSMTVLTNDGRTVAVSRVTVLRVMYTQLYRGKLYIQKTDGRVIEAHIIDEDQEFYTVRTELNSPKEFTIRRDDVLFMTRKNPSALEGRVSYRHVDLSWRAPYTPDNPAKRFRIYLRTKGGDFGAAGVTSGTSYRVRGLGCNTEYYAIVTAVDRSGCESLPSNVVRFTTRKGKPVPPGNIRVPSVTSEAGGSCVALVAWDSAVEPCGAAITEYGVYVRDESALAANAAGPTGKQFPGYRLAGKTRENSFKVTRLKDRNRYRVLVTSIDSTRDESPAGWSFSFSTKNRMPEYPYPVVCETVSPREGAGLAVKLSWNRAVDPDGNVTGYRVYRTTENGPLLLGATDKNGFEVKGLSPADKHNFTVRSVDNRGGESPDSYTASTGLVRYAGITVKGAFLMPAGNYGRLYHPGWGGTVTVSAENLFLDRLTLGVETGYWHFRGKTDVSGEAALVPFMAAVSYRIHLARWVSLDPAAGFGGCYNMASISSMAIVPAGLFFMERYTRRDAVELMFSAGLDVTFTIGKIALIRVGGTYNGIAERGGLLGMISVHGGAGVRI